MPLGALVKFDPQRFRPRDFGPLDWHIWQMSVLPNSFFSLLFFYPCLSNTSRDVQIFPSQPVIRTGHFSELTGPNTFWPDRFCLGFSHRTFAPGLVPFGTNFVFDVGIILSCTCHVCGLWRFEFWAIPRYFCFACPYYIFYGPRDDSFDQCFNVIIGHASYLIVIRWKSHSWIGFCQDFIIKITQYSITWHIQQMHF